jgi:tetratricopeptide (TPR) repeat protein
VASWVPQSLDELVLSLVSKDPNERPQSAEEVLEALETIGGAEAGGALLSEEEVTARIDALLAAPDSVDAAIAVESAVAQGADKKRVAGALIDAATKLADDPNVGNAAPTVKLLSLRAAKLLLAAGSSETAEQILLALVNQNPEDKAVQLAFEDALRKQGKHHELVEALLSRVEAAPSREERAVLMAKIGRIYETNLADPEQALVAYTQAVSEDPKTADYASSIERIAGKDTAHWTEVLSTLTDGSADETGSYRADLLLRMAAWYPNIQRLDLTVSCLQAILADDPSNLAAWAALTDLYRKAQQWPELSTVLLAYADVVSPERARSLRAEAADIAELRLNDTARAREIYEHVLRDDPSHAQALDGLGRIYERAGDYAALLGLLKTRLNRARGTDRIALALRVAELCEDRLSDVEEAKAQYQTILNEDPSHLDALRGLDRVHSRQGNFKELLQNLQAQERLAPTPRQRIVILTRMAAIYDEEFLSHEQAAAALEQVLKIDATHEAALTELARHYRALERWEDLATIYAEHAEHTNDEASRIRSLLGRARVLGSELSATERAIAAYEAVLELAPEEPQALEALARLRESSGDANQALRAVLALAEKAESSEAKAEHYLRAARLCITSRELSRAVDLYKQVLDLQPSSSAALAGLREAYLEQGSARAAVEVLYRQIEVTEGGSAKAKLAVVLARLLKDKLGDDEGAERAARQALVWDLSNEQALLIFADSAFAAGRFSEANQAYAELAGRVDSLPRDMAVHVLTRQIDALFEQGSIAGALQSLDLLLRFAPDDMETLRRAATLAFDHAPPQRSSQLSADLLLRFGDSLTPADLITFTYRLGESLRKSGDIDRAIETLEEASDLAPGSRAPLDSLAQAHAARGDFNKVLDIKQRLLDLTDGEQRVALMIEIGELWSEQLKDTAKATKIFVAALEEHPNNRKLLTRLMQTYSETKEWEKLADVVVKLANFVDDPAQKSKYLLTAAMLCARELSDPGRALQLYAQVLALEPGHSKALAESIAIETSIGNFVSVERLLKQKLKSARDSQANDVALTALLELGRLYKNELGRADAAIEAYEGALALSPENAEVSEALAGLYERDLSKYAERSIALQSQSLRRDPYRVDAYKNLRRIYTESRRADPSWCLCQALYVLKLSDASEEQFFKRMRSEDPAYARAAFSETDWQLVTHPDIDPQLTNLFAIIEPVVIMSRSRPIVEYGYHPSQVLDLGKHPNPLAQTLFYSAGVLGMSPPPTFENPNAPAPIAFLQAEATALVLGGPSREAGSQRNAFTAAHQLAYLRPGFYVRCLLPSIASLKAWLLASIKLISPQFQVSPDLAGPVEEAVTALGTHLPRESKDALASVVSRLLRNANALDLKKWVASVDLTADRVGLVLAHDLETAIECVRAAGEGDVPLSTQQRLKELVLFAISEAYFGIRKDLGISIDA